MDYAKREYYRARNEWKTLNEEKDSIGKIEKMAWSEFYAAVMGYVDDNNLISPFTKKKAEDENDSKMSFDDEVVKSAYRQAALRSHPDKESGNEELFQELSQAKQEGNLNKFIDCAKQLDVSIEDISISHVEALEQEVEEMRKNVLDMTSSPHWVWFHSSKNKKQLIIERICNATTEEQG